MDVLHNIAQEVRELETLVYGFLGIWCTDFNGMYGFLTFGARVFKDVLVL